MHQFAAASLNAEDVRFKLIVNYQQQGKGREIWKTPLQERAMEGEEEKNLLIL